MDKCYEIEEYKNNLSQITNESNLSIGMISYIIHDLCNYIDNLYQQSLEQEQLNNNRKIKEENNNEQTSTSVD